MGERGLAPSRGLTTTPHDALFKAAFSKPRHARGLLRALLPTSLGQKITWETLRLESGIAVGDEDLDEQRMDLVYSVRAKKRRVLMYVLAEHQSKVDPWMAFRLLSYPVAMTAGGRVAILSLKHGRDQIAMRIQVLAPDGRAASARDVLAGVLRYILETSRAEPATLRELLARQARSLARLGSVPAADCRGRRKRGEGKQPSIGPRAEVRPCCSATGVVPRRTRPLRTPARIRQ